MLEAIFKTAILNISLFITLLIAIPIGTYISKTAKGVSAIIMLGAGGALMYFSFWITAYCRSDIVYHWYYFISSASLIGMMNDGNTIWGAPKNAQHASTYLFFGAFVASITFLFIY